MQLSFIKTLLEKIFCKELSMMYNKKVLCPCSLMDRVLVFGTSDGGSIPFRGTKKKFLILTVISPLFTSKTLGN